MSRYKTIYTEVEVEVDLTDFETEDLLDELESRGAGTMGHGTGPYDSKELVEQIWMLRRNGKDDPLPLCIARAVFDHLEVGMHVNLIDELGRKDRGSRQLIDANGEWAGFQNIPIKTPHRIRCCKALEKPWGYRHHVGTASFGPLNAIEDACDRVVGDLHRHLHASGGHFHRATGEKVGLAIREECPLSASASDE